MKRLPVIPAMTRGCSRQSWLDLRLGLEATGLGENPEEVGTLVLDGKAADPYFGEPADYQQSSRGNENYE